MILNKISINQISTTISIHSIKHLKSQSSQQLIISINEHSNLLLTTLILNSIDDTFQIELFFWSPNKWDLTVCIYFSYIILYNLGWLLWHSISYIHHNEILIFLVDNWIESILMRIRFFIVSLIDNSTHG